jgi:aryl-alcohol dehydrogenase-like predicted oxidoreductase
MSNRVNIPRTDLKVSPLCLGGNVFGWSADEASSKTILSDFVTRGGHFVDTADVYSGWKTGNSGGESETIIGNWLKESGNRNQMIIATKVAKYSRRPGLSASNIKAAVEDSLSRLQTDYIDIYYAHEDDQKTPLEETLRAFNELVESGKVRYIAASQYTGARLTEALATSKANGFASYIALQNEYNIMARDLFESRQSHSSAWHAASSRASTDLASPSIQSVPLVLRTFKTIEVGESYRYWTKSQRNIKRRSQRSRWLGCGFRKRSAFRLRAHERWNSSGR